MGTIAAEGNWSGDYEADSQSSDELFSTESDHQQTKPNGEPKVQHGEDGLSAESLNTLKREEVEHSKHKTIDQGQEVIQQTPGPQHQQTPSTTVETSGRLPLDTKAVPECKQDLEVTEDDTKTKGSQIGAKEISPTTEIGKVKVYKKNPKLKDDYLKIIEDLPMAPENVVINIMEEISTNSDEYVVNANKYFATLWGPLKRGKQWKYQRK